MAVAAATCSVSDNPPRLLRRLSTTSRNDFMLPSAFVRLIPYLSMYSFICFVGFAMFARAVFSEVPAASDFMDAFAIRPIARETSSTEYPSAPATGATFWKVAPIIATSVFELLDACASTSAKRPA